MTGAEVVERGQDTDGAQTAQDVDRALHVRHHDVLGDLELQVL